MTQETAALAALRKALAASSRAGIAKTAVAVKPDFAKRFMTIGDFGPYDT